MKPLFLSGIQSVLRSLPILASVKQRLAVAVVEDGLELGDEDVVLRARAAGCGRTCRSRGPTRMTSRSTRKPTSCAPNSTSPLFRLARQRIRLLGRRGSRLHVARAALAPRPPPSRPCRPRARGPWARPWRRSPVPVAPKATVASTRLANTSLRDMSPSPRVQNDCCAPRNPCNALRGAKKGAVDGSPDCRAFGICRGGAQTRRRHFPVHDRRAPPAAIR